MKVEMFLWTVARSASNRDAQERFQHSGEIGSRYFHEVLGAINSLIPEYIKFPNIDVPIVFHSPTSSYGNRRKEWIRLLSWISMY